MTIAEELGAKIKKRQQKLPVDVVGIANDLGLGVWQTKKWGDDLSGKIAKSEKYGGKSGYAIVINANHPIERRRFTIAHEIAHFILHKDKIGDGIIDDALYHSGLQNDYEKEANNLAVKILMPLKAVMEEIDKGAKDLDELAEIFKVTQNAMSVRLLVPYDKKQDKQSLLPTPLRRVFSKFEDLFT